MDRKRFGGVDIAVEVKLGACRLTRVEKALPSSPKSALSIDLLVRLIALSSSEAEQKQVCSTAVRKNILSNMCPFVEFRGMRPL